ncbi:MAG: hypothetical protein E3J86_04905 [Candidatus Thorarchaeota archaeon]|nr:MAG: hypothetical protein E3J86_04905 [Candidatus Thorarchaeota archaeon]
MTKITKSMITSFSKFKSAWEKDAGKPENTIMYYVIAALNIEKDPKLADAMMTVLVSKRDCMEDGGSPSGLKLGRSAKYFIGQFKKNKNIARSYVGGTYKNEYKFSKSNLTMTVVKKQEHGKGLKIFIDSGGKDLNTPVQLRSNSSGQWKLTEYSSICTGVRKTVEEEGDF